jgi:hypothetical protein
MFQGLAALAEISPKPALNRIVFLFSLDAGSQSVFGVIQSGRDLRGSGDLCGGQKDFFNEPHFWAVGYLRAEFAKAA